MQRLFPAILLAVICTSNAWSQGPNRSAIGAVHDNPRIQLVAAGSITMPEAPGNAGFLVTAGDEIFPYNVVGLFVVPNQIVDLAAAPKGIHAKALGDVTFKYTAGELEKLRSESPQFEAEIQGPKNKWRWRAPEEPGLYQLELSNEISRTVINAFVMVPIERVEKGRLEGYRMGNYPAKPLRGNSAYLPPRGFVRVTEDNQNTLVSPHFTVKQFLCKQVGDFPKFITLRERLIMKLEQIYAKVISEGVEVDTLYVMSGFRTPWYNKAIGNVKYSRHQWGGAADIFIDADKDGYMDDLNKDGKRNVKDAKLLKSWIEAVSKQPEYAKMFGGLGLYAEASHRGPFVHVDVRGYKARW